MVFFNLFGNKKRKDELSPHKVIMGMKETLESLEKREKFLETRITEYKTQARSFVKINKPKALSFLKKASMNEKQLNSIYAQKNNIETQIITIEQGINNKNVVSAMKLGKSTLENMTKTMDPDDIGELMDDISSIIDMSSDVSDALSGPVGPVYDDDELLADLEEEIKVEDEKKISSYLMKMKEPSVSNLQDIPTNKLEEVRTEEEELAELEKMMTL